MKVAVSHNRHERVSSEDGFGLIDLTNGGSLKMQFVTTPKEGPYSLPESLGFDEIHLWWPSIGATIYTGASMEDVLDSVEFTPLNRHRHGMERRRGKS